MTLPDIPDVPECTVQLKDGEYLITHRRTGDTETAETLEQVTTAGVILRVSAAHAGDTPFTTGDNPL